MFRATLCTIWLCVAICVPAMAGDIHDAIQAGNLETVKQLLAQNPDLIENTDEGGMTPLLTAASEGKLDILKYLIANKADLSAVNDRRSTALHLAAFGGHPKVAEYLLTLDVDINAKNAGGFTPLIFAAYRAHPDIVKILIDKGAEKSHTDNTWGGTAIHWAANRGNRETLAMLMSGGYDLKMLSVADSSRPLNWAANAGNVETLEYLLDNGVDPNSAMPNGWSALHNASAKGSLDAVKVLVEHGADVHTADEEGNTVFGVAVATEHFDIAGYFIDHGVDINRRDNDNMTPLHWASLRGNMDLARLLLEKGAELNIFDNHHFTPLLRAAGSQNLELINLLIENGADVNVADENGTTAVMHAINNGASEIVSVLLANGADINQRENHYGHSELHRAAIRGYGDIAARLLDAGSDIDALDNDNHTPLYYARLYHNDKTADVIKSYGAKDESGQAAPDLLHEPLAEGDAVIWYLNHCGFAVKTANHLLIFDYWNRGAAPDEPNMYNGHIDTGELAGQDVTVFVTHDHTDHYDTMIYDWADKVDNISYVYGFNPEESRVHADSGYHGPEYTYIPPRGEREIDGMKITTIAANDAGVGYVVEVDGVTLYHAGDHAGWREGERNGYTAEIDFLAEKFSNIDYAFMNVTGCHVQDTAALAASVVYAMQKLHPKYWFPTHGANREYVYPEFVGKEAIAAEPCKAIIPRCRGDRYIFKDGRAL